MPRVLAVLAFLVPYLAPVTASEPGQPLDCSDWVFLEPGHSCMAWAPYGCGDASGSFCHPAPPINNSAFDNTGAQYRYERVFLRDDVCGPLNQIRILRYDGQAASVLAHLDERCLDGNTRDLAEQPEGFYIDFDEMNGRLFVWVKSRCFNNTQPVACTYQSGWWVAAIDGFATTFEILQTYEPASSSLSFRVPYMPEGLRAAEWFDTFYGDLATVGDWSQAQPLRCDYPLQQPAVGDYLTVEDGLPDPPPGSGYYFVTAATYNGETRYGRQSTAGILSGRPPAALPACDR